MGMLTQSACRERGQVCTAIVLPKRELRRRKAHVMATLMTYLLMEPYAEWQKFAQHALDALVAKFKGATDQSLQIEA